VLLIAFLYLWLKFWEGIDIYWIVPVRKLFYFHHWLYVNSAKAVTDDRKCTLLANSYMLPPEYDFENDCECSACFMGNFSQYRMGKSFNERPFVRKMINKMPTLPTPGKISADAHAAH